jgi:hypothetical protein
MLFWDVIKNPITPTWIQTICTIAGVIIGIIGVKVSLPKITKQINVISDEISKKKFDVCERCPFKSACVSPHLAEVGDFDKENEIDNKGIREGIIQLYEEIKNYKFDNDKLRFFGTKEHQECLLGKLTMALNLIGGANMAFNKVKDENESKLNKQAR